MVDSVVRQVRLSHEEDQRLRQRAGERGMSEEELIREAIRLMVGDSTDRRVGDEASDARAEWQAVRAIFEARAKLPVSPEDRAGGRGWTREDAYDERLRRFDR